MILPAAVSLALILGESETAARSVQVKSLRSEGTGEQAPSVAWAELAGHLAGLLHTQITKSR